jgi:hypothetical protein
MMATLVWSGLDLLCLRYDAVCCAGVEEEEQEDSFERRLYFCAVSLGNRVRVCWHGVGKGYFVRRHPQEMARE